MKIYAFPCHMKTYVSMWEGKQVGHKWGKWGTSGASGAQVGQVGHKWWGNEASGRNRLI